MAFSFRRLAFGVLLLNASGGILYPILPILEFHRGGGPLLSTLIVAAPLLAQVLASFLWGALSDRWGRRRELLVLGVLGQSALFLAYPLLSPVGLLLVRVLQTGLGASSALATAVATEDPGQTMGHGLGSLSFWGGVGSFLGILAGLPFVTGPQFSATSLDAILLFSLLAALSAGSVIFLGWAGELSRARAHVSLRGLLRFRSGPWVILLSAATAVVALGNYVTYTIFPLFVDRVVTPMGFAGYPVNATQQLALLSLGAAAGGILISPWTGRMVEGARARRALFLTAPLVYALLWVGFAEIRVYWLIFLIWAYPAAVTLQVPLVRELAALTLGEERGRAVGLWNAAYNLGGLGGALLAGGAYSEGVSFADIFLLAALVDAFGFLALLWVMRRPRGRSEVLLRGPRAPASE